MKVPSEEQTQIFPNELLESQNGGEGLQRSLMRSPGRGRGKKPLEPRYPFRAREDIKGNCMGRFKHYWDPEEDHFKNGG